MGAILSKAYAELHQPLPRGDYPTAVFPAGLRDFPRFSGPPSHNPADDAAYAADIERRTEPNAEDLSNELDEEVCTVLLVLINRGRFEDAGRALAVVKEAAHRRYISCSWGDTPSDADYPMAALQKAGLA